MTDTAREPREHPRIWNSLEIIKVAATVTTPIVVFILGCFIWASQRSAIHHWELQQAEQLSLAETNLKERERIRDFRLTIYKETAPLLNDIVSYHFYVGRWREQSPAGIIEKKRQLDERLYPHRALFTPEFFGFYHAFMRQSFRTAGNHYGESRIRTQAQCRHPNANDHPERWLAYFTGEDRRQGLCLAYSRLLGQVSEELLLQSLKMAPQSKDAKFSLCPPFFEIENC